jgi:hypothetical protein
MCTEFRQLASKHAYATIKFTRHTVKTQIYKLKKRAICVQTQNVSNELWIKCWFSEKPLHVHA